MKKHSLTLLWMLVISSLLVTGIGIFLRYQILEPLGIQREESAIELPFVMLADAKLQYEINRNYNLMMNPPTDPPETEPPSEPPTEPPTEPPVTEPVYVTLDESWFDDALFIGESRSVGLKDYARLGKADYFCGISMSVFDVRQRYCADRDYGSTSLRWVLENNTYGKIYIHLGLNDISGDLDMVMASYQELIDMIRELQPNAYIILQPVLTITRAKASSRFFPIDKLIEMNNRLKAIAESNPEVFRICDYNQVLADEEGYMRPDVVTDGCHLTYDGYNAWADWILEDAGWYGIP